MSWAGRVPRLAAGLLALALGACAVRPPRVEPETGAFLQARAESMRAWPAWSFEGRVAVRDGKEGGSSLFPKRPANFQGKVSTDMPDFYP